METPGCSSRKPEDESSVETLISTMDNDDDIDGKYHVSNFATCNRERKNMTVFL